MTLDDWKNLLEKDRRAACRALFRIENEIDGDDPIEWGPDALAAQLEALHCGDETPYHLLPDAELLAQAVEVFEDENKPDPPEEEVRLEVQYKCPACGQYWDEESDSACDSECPRCSTGDITALSWRVLS